MRVLNPFSSQDHGLMYFTVKINKRSNNSPKPSTPFKYLRVWYNYPLSHFTPYTALEHKKKLTYTIMVEAEAPSHNAGASSTTTSIKQINKTN